MHVRTHSRRYSPSSRLVSMPVTEGSCRHLAVRVIDQAFRDLAGPHGSSADRLSARTFLSGSSMLYYWCQVADIDAASMIIRARKLMASSHPFSAHRATSS